MRPLFCAQALYRARDSWRWNREKHLQKMIYHWKQGRLQQEIHRMDKEMEDLKEQQECISGFVNTLNFSI